ncbi:MAG: type II secretion system protein [Patescibacteria group bacterium]|jgi:prepilin-type N-terminal cleavage/methylation domain-containing protein
MFKIKNNKNKLGFTLVELLVVIAIIGILATLAIVSIQNTRSKARDTKRIADIKQIQTALELYFNDNGSYPVSTSVTSSIRSASRVYMEMYPQAPNPPDGDCTESNNQYVYTETGEDNGSYTLFFCLGGTNSGISSGLAVASPVGVEYGSLDEDAFNFIQATGITDITQQLAINTLVNSLKSNSLWTKMKAIYPFVGGTATTHKFNLKDPRDADSAYRLVFTGGWAHTATGVDPNGSTGYADTKLVPNTALSLNNSGASIYIRQNTVVGTSGLIDCDFGSVNETSTFSKGLHIFVRNGVSDTLRYRVNTGTVSFLTNSDARGFYTISRLSSATSYVYKNGVEFIETAQASTEMNPYSIIIGAVNSNVGPMYFSNREIAFFAIHDGLTPTEQATLNTINTTFQTALSRNVDY